MRTPVYEQLTLFPEDSRANLTVLQEKKGKDDERHLWPEFMRVTRELQPRYVVGENVTGLLSTIHDDVCTDLENAGYKVQTLVVPAYAVGGHHERYRVAIIGINQSKPRLQADPKDDTTGTWKKTREHVMRVNWDYLPGTYWVVHKPPVFGMVDGIPGGMDGRLKYKSEMTAFGNAVVPQQFYPIFKAIAEVEEQQ